MQQPRYWSICRLRTHCRGTFQYIAGTCQRGTLCKRLGRSCRRRHWSCRLGTLCMWWWSVSTCLSRIAHKRCDRCYSRSYLQDKRRRSLVQWSPGTCQRHKRYRTKPGHQNKCQLRKKSRKRSRQQRKCRLGILRSQCWSFPTFLQGRRCMPWLRRRKSYHFGTQSSPWLSS